MARANPSACCGIATACCENRLPETLRATFANVAHCACIAGMEVLLSWRDIDVDP